MRKQQPTVTISTRLDPDLTARLRAHAGDAGVSSYLAKLIAAVIGDSHTKPVQP